MNVDTEVELNDDNRLSALSATSNEAEIPTSAERRVTRSTVRQQQNKCKQKAESSTSSARDSIPRMFVITLIVLSRPVKIHFFVFLCTVNPSLFYSVKYSM